MLRMPIRVRFSKRLHCEAVTLLSTPENYRACPKVPIRCERGRISVYRLTGTGAKRVVQPRLPLVVDSVNSELLDGSLVEYQAEAGPIRDRD